MDIRSLDQRSTSNDALACPAGICSVPADFDSAVFPLPVNEVLTIVETVIGNEPRTKLVAKEEELQQRVFVQRSRIFRFPDTIWIQALSRGGGTALIMYSRSNYGDSDLGVNKRRVEKWMTKLTERLQKPGAGN